MDAGSVQKQIERLTEDSRIRRYDTGVYYFPQKSRCFSFGTTLSFDDVVTKEYMMDGASRCGYVSGIMFANWLRLTTQVPMVYDIYTNKATADSQTTQLVGIRIILRRPCVPVNDQNALTLQFLDLLKDVTDIAEVEGRELSALLNEYAAANSISRDSIAPYLPYYPDQIYQNMKEVGLFYDVSA